jgi:L-aspartate oxidase
MFKYHEDGELAPRDIVSRSIWKELIQNNKSCVYLDISHKDSDWIKKRFPTIYSYCLDHKIDMTKESIPVVPAAHYTCGGVKSDIVGKTNVKNLYVVGEVACTGLHGANRLASTSLLEGLTWGYKAGIDIASNLDEFEQYDGNQIQDWVVGEMKNDPALIAQDWLTLKHSMWNYAGIIRSKNRLARANAMFLELASEVEKFYKNAELSDELVGLRNAIEVSQIVVSSSRRNKNPIGCFYLE